MDNNQFNSNNNSSGSYNASQAGSYNANSQQNNAYQYDQQNAYGNNGGNIPPQGNMPFYKTTKGIIAIALSLVLILGLVYWGFNNLIGYTRIDLAKNVSLKLSGESGTATLSSSNVRNNVDYDKSNEKLKTFVNSIRYSVSKNMAIKNGDKVKVTVVYSESLAKECKVKVTNAEKEITISGLGEKFEDGSKVSSEVASKMKTDADSKMQQMISGINGAVWEATPTYHSMYLAKTTEGNDIVIAVYDLKLLYKQTNRSVNYFVYTYCTSGVNTNYEKNSILWNGYTSVSIIGNNLYGYGNFLQTTDRRLISDASMIESCITINRLFTGKTITKINV
ncbi:MAG TPA: hypothetical protein DCL62_08725 [Kandleria vitulina]|nr:hypothetical protein [Kandleria vitulina]